MNKIINEIIFIIILIVLYFCLQKYKKNCNYNNNNNNNIKYTEDFITLNENEIENDNKIIFNYDTLREVDEKFIKDQENKLNNNIIYPNKWIEKIDDNNNVIFNNINTDNIKKSNIEFSYDFNEPLVKNLDSVVDIKSFKENMGRTVKEVYDNSFIDYKKLIPKKNKIDVENELTYLNGSSDLTFITPDTWLYENEKPENGGEIKEGLYGNDPIMTDTVARF